MVYWFSPEYYAYLKAALSEAGLGNMDQYFTLNENTGNYECTDYASYVALINDIFGEEAAYSEFLAWSGSEQIKSTQGGGNL